MKITLNKETINNGYCPLCQMPLIKETLQDACHSCNFAALYSLPLRSPNNIYAVALDDVFVWISDNNFLLIGYNRWEGQDFSKSALIKDRTFTFDLKDVEKWALLQ